MHSMESYGSSATGSGSAPLKANPSSTMNSSYTLEHINPFIKSALDNHETKIPFKRLITNLCSIEESYFDSLVQAIRTANWLSDPDVHDAAVRFCRGVLEKERCDPFAKLSNRILHLATDDTHLRELAITYPISDGFWVHSDQIVIERHKQHGPNGAERRKPDVVYLRRQHFDPEVLSGRKKIRKWSELLLYCELKEPSPAEERGPIICSVLSTTQHQGICDSQRPPLASVPRPLSRLATPSSSRDDSEEQPPSGRSSGKRKQAPAGSEASAVFTGSGSKRAKRVTSAKDARAQAAGYALEILSSTDGSRSHCIGLILFRQELSLCYYDAAGIVTTSDTIPIIDQFATFAAVIISLARCTPAQLGATPGIDPPADKRYPDHFPPETMKGYTIDFTPASGDHSRSELNDAPSVALQSVPAEVGAPQGESSRITITLRRPIFSRYALVGRHTVVYRAVANGTVAICAAGTALVVKISQQIATRPKESDMLNHARQVGVRNLPELHLAKDLWRLEDGLRGKIPENEQVNYESRVLRALVYTECQPLDALFSTSAKYLGEMVYQMLDCLHDLRYNAGILHRDISFNNIMVQLGGPDGKPRFILNDFDLAMWVAEDGKPKGGPTSKHRTGTLPFMSWEILYDLWAIHERKSGGDPLPAEHRLRYDYESLLYVALWCAFKCEEAPHLKAEIIDQAAHWELGCYGELYSKKLALLSRPRSGGVHSLELFPFTPSFEPWKDWFFAWISTVSSAACLVDEYGTEAFPNKRSKTSDPSLVIDYETVNGVWTRDNILKALRAAEPSPLPQ